jgi:C4-dicarboxylate-specific signal transduction histidine kinase
MNQLWQQEAERMGGQPLVAILTEMRDNQLDLRADFEQLSRRVSSLQAANERLLSGFPADDVEGHRRYHESVIEWRELRNKMVKEALAKMVQAGALAAFGWLALAIWQTFKITVTK